MVRNSISISLAALLLGLGCGPGGPPSLEGFGSLDDTGPGDGDPGDGDPGDGDGDGDGDPGDGDGDPQACTADYNLGAQAPAFAEGFLEPSSDSRVEFSCFGDPAAPEAIISWTAPETGDYTVYVEGEFLPELLVDVGACDPQAPFDCYPPFEFIGLTAQAGQTHTFVVQDAESFGGYWYLAIEPDVVIPSTCPDGFIEPGLPAAWSGNTAGADNEFWSDCGGGDARDRSYLFIPEITGIYRLDTFGSSYDTVAHVFDGECGGPVLACNDDSPEGGLDSELEVELSAGQIYTIVIDGYGAESGTFNANLELILETGCPQVSAILPPQVPAVEQWILGDSPSAQPMFSCGPNGGQQRFLWEAPSPGQYRFTTVGSEAPTSLMVFNGVCDEGDVFECESGPPPGGASIERFVEAGEVVDIIVTHQYNAGVGVLTVESTVAPTCEPTALMGPLPIQVQGQTSGPSQFAGTCGDGSGSAPEAVYSFTAPAAGAYRFTTNGSTYDTLMYLRDDSCAGPEMCDDDGGPGLTSRIDRMMSQGETVTIFVDGYGGDQGNYTLTISQL